MQPHQRWMTQHPNVFIYKFHAQPMMADGITHCFLTPQLTAASPT
jgi:hypothetical protein